MLSPWFWRSSARERFARTPRPALVIRRRSLHTLSAAHSSRPLSLASLPLRHHVDPPPRRFGFSWSPRAPLRAFSSEIWFREKRLILGTFDTAEEAARAHDATAWRLLGPRRDMNFPDVSSQRAQDLAPLPRLFTDKDRRVHQRRQRRLTIAEMDVEALVVWRERFPQDIVDERQFYKQRRLERDARRTERAAYREDKRSRNQAAQLKLKLRETSGWDFEDEQHADAYIQTSEEDITESESESDE
nr:uncharacterized protein LOC109784347 [Aegilops tauschii subsp. strangulata]